MFSLVCVWINGWVNNHEAGDLRRYSAHYDVIIMYDIKIKFQSKQIIIINAIIVKTPVIIIMGMFL